MKPKLLIVDKDESTRDFLRKRLSRSYDLVETADSEHALGLALKTKPDAILLELLMPRFSGLELCQSLHSLTYTTHIPLFVLTAESSTQYRTACESLGVRAYLSKPVNVNELKKHLSAELRDKKPDTRSQFRLNMRVALRLRGTNLEGKEFEVLTATENVSANGFLCPCSAPLAKGSVVNVYMTGKTERFAGQVMVVRKETAGNPSQRYGFVFKERSLDWVLQA